MQNDILATGILTFLVHEIVYFGRSLPWIIIDAMPFFRRWKIQAVSLAPLAPVHASHLATSTGSNH